MFDENLKKCRPHFHYFCQSLRLKQLGSGWPTYSKHRSHLGTKTPRKKTYARYTQEKFENDTLIHLYN